MKLYTYKYAKHTPNDSEGKKKHSNQYIHYIGYDLIDWLLTIPAQRRHSTQ